MPGYTPLTRHIHPIYFPGTRHSEYLYRSQHRRPPRTRRAPSGGSHEIPQTPGRGPPGSLPRYHRRAGRRRRGHADRRLQLGQLELEAARAPARRPPARPAPPGRPPSAWTSPTTTPPSGPRTSTTRTSTPRSCTSSMLGPLLAGDQRQPAEHPDREPGQRGREGHRREPGDRHQPRPGDQLRGRAPRAAHLRRHHRRRRQGVHGGARLQHAYGLDACAYISSKVKSGYVLDLEGDLTSSNGADRTNAFNSCMAANDPNVHILKDPTVWTDGHSGHRRAERGERLRQPAQGDLLAMVQPGHRHHPAAEVQGPDRQGAPGQRRRRAVRDVRHRQRARSTASQSQPANLYAYWALKYALDAAKGVKLSRGPARRRRADPADGQLGATPTSATRSWRRS